MSYNYTPKPRKTTGKSVAKKRIKIRKAGLGGFSLYLDKEDNLVVKTRKGCGLDWLTLSNPNLNDDIEIRLNGEYTLTLKWTEL